MGSVEIVDLCSDDELGEEVVNPNRVGAGRRENDSIFSVVKLQKLKTPSMRDALEETRSSNGLRTGGSSNGDQNHSPASSTLPMSSAAPLCRQFWKAGNFGDGEDQRTTFQNGKSYLHVHPMFLHSNATSHKWAFGAIAELLDNAIDEVDYELNASSGSLEKLCHHGTEHFMSNLGILLQWSPYSTEAELLKQFDDVGLHGTKIVIYNLWKNDDGHLELDFDSDPEDICLLGDTKKVSLMSTARTSKEQHIANRYNFSLRVYSSILYMRLPEGFRIVLRGRDVDHHNLATDLKFQQFIQYRPQSVEGSVITTIGFLKEAPRVNIHGFNVYHKNRLILPFWRVVSSTNGRGRGVVGVLEANFIEPTHNKQDFERTSLFQKLENRLKEMTLEYWNCHCKLIGYQIPRKVTSPFISEPFTPSSQCRGGDQLVILEARLPAISTVRGASCDGPFKQSKDGGKLNSMGKYEGLCTKRKEHAGLVETNSLKRHAGKVTPPVNAEGTSGIQSANTATNQSENQKLILLGQNKKLHDMCLELKNAEEDLNLKAAKLRVSYKGYSRNMLECLKNCNR